jgi:hypothetical protein
MPNPSTIDLEHRIIALENTARRWRRISIAILLCSAAALLVAADSPGSASDEIRTRKLILLDEEGRTLADLSSAKGKFGGLKFYNPETHAIVSAIGINLDGTGFLQTRTMLLVDEQGRTVGDLLYAKDKASGLRFYNPDTKFCVSGFGFGADGSGVEYLNTREGKQVIIHTGAVNEKGVPLEDVQKALDQLRRSAIP